MIKGRHRRPNWLLPVTAAVAAAVTGLTITFVDGDETPTTTVPPSRDTASQSAPGAPTPGATSRGSPSPPSDVGLPATDYTVQPGDTLWRIAAEKLGDPTRWPELFEANREREQPDGWCLADPDLIYPDWQITIPRSTGRHVGPSGDFRKTSTGGRHARSIPG
jgi:nucleoid-associated protein YgaU